MVVRMMKVSDLKPHPRNSEFFDDIGGDSWDEFLRSVSTSGVIEPIIITEDNVIVSGHQRVRACKELSIDEVMTETRSYSSEDSILKDLIETNIRQRGIGNPNPVKFGRCIAELERIYGIRKGNNQYNRLDNIYPSSPHTEQELANVLGVSVPSLKNYKKLAQLIPEVEDFLDTGMISANTALAISRQLSKDDQMALISQLDSQTKYTAKEVQKYIDEINRLKEDTASSKESYNEMKKDIAAINKENTHLKNENSSLSNELANTNSLLNSARAELEELRTSKLSPAAQTADFAYDFYKAAQSIITNYLSPAAYNGIVDLNSETSEYFVKGCNMLVNAVTDVFRASKMDEINIY